MLVAATTSIAVCLLSYCPLFGLSAVECVYGRLSGRRGGFDTFQNCPTWCPTYSIYRQNRGTKGTWVQVACMHLIIQDPRTMSGITIDLSQQEVASKDCCLCACSRIFANLGFHGPHSVSATIAKMYSEYSSRLLHHHNLQGDKP